MPKIAEYSVRPEKETFPSAFRPFPFLFHCLKFICVAGCISIFSGIEEHLFPENTAGQKLCVCSTTSVSKAADRSGSKGKVERQLEKPKGP